MKNNNNNNKRQKAKTRFKLLRGEQPDSNLVLQRQIIPLEREVDLLAADIGRSILFSSSTIKFFGQNSNWQALTLPKVNQVLSASSFDFSTSTFTTPPFNKKWNTSPKWKLDSFTQH